MKHKLFDDIPGVGEILMYQIDEKIGEKKHWLEQRVNNLRLDDLAFKQLETGKPVPFAEYENICGKDLIVAAINLPFLRIENQHISFAFEKFLVAGVLIPIYEAINKKKDVPNLKSLMPYDYISYLRPVIEAEDDQLIIYGINNSNNNHYIRFLFMLLRRCGTEGNKSWHQWIEQYIADLPEVINSYSEFTVQCDARVTYATIAGKEVLYSFVNRMIGDKKLQEYEKRHFIESLGTPQRAGEVLYWKIVEGGYRPEIAPRNIFSIHFFASEKIQKLLKRISVENESDQIRKIAKIALGFIDNPQN